MIDQYKAWDFEVPYFIYFQTNSYVALGPHVLNWLAILLLEELMLGEWQSDLWKIQFDLGPGLK